MPSLSCFMKSSNQGGGQTDTQDHSDTHASLDNDNTENEVQHRTSKRHFLRNLLMRSSSNSRSGPQTVAFEASRNSQVQPLSTSEDPATRTSNEDQLSPHFNVGESDSIPGQTENFGRTSSPLTIPELHKIFSGAPQFFSISEAHRTGAPHPSVAFPWDSGEGITNLCDHLQINDKAWSSITAWPHITKDSQGQLTHSNAQREKQEAHFLPRCRERPHMLSMQGIERGTIGYTAALELGVADALQEQIPLPKECLLGDRQRFLGGRDGLRPLTEPKLVERLIMASVTYHGGHLKDAPPSIDLYTDLFTQVLYPPPRVTDSNDPYSLRVQIEVLVEILAAPVWVDFSLVEWRVKLCQILWGPAVDYNSDADIIISGGNVQQPAKQKFWLLLQILLSCELLLRLDQITTNIEAGLEIPQPSDIRRLEESATMNVRWSLILARVWLDNIQLEIRSVDTISPKKPSPGWLATLKRTGDLPDGTVCDTLHYVQIQGKHEARQLSGLLRFARELHWPNAEALARKIINNEIGISDGLPSQWTNELFSSSTSRTNSYSRLRRSGVRRGSTKSPGASAVFHPPGWLSNSYVSGLILPGESLGHILISTLLANDEAAVSRLGPEASLFSGFSYSGRSFWSTSCIVGRVLASGKGAFECVGWISSDVVPRGFGDGWVTIDVESLPVTEAYRTKARVWHTAAIQHDSNVIGNADSRSLLKPDFIIPSDESIQEVFSIEFKSLSLSTADPSNIPRRNPTTENSGDSHEIAAIPTYSAAMTFSVESEEEEQKQIIISLRYDVLFVTAHPCIVDRHAERILSSTALSAFTRDRPGLSIHAGHPIHKASFPYRKVSLFSLLFSAPPIPFDSILSPTIDSLGEKYNLSEEAKKKLPKFLIIDCTDISMTAYPVRPSPLPQTSHSHKQEFGSSVEMLARALCAEQGWNALISRRGRGCLACAIREAGALGWRVVLRLA